MRDGPLLEEILPESRSPKERQRIAKLLARAGIASRREVERMIADGRVAIGGEPVETPATLVSSLHGVTVDGKPVRAPAPARLFLYHKPAGALTAERDPKGRPTIYDRMPSGLPRLMPVGRLDLNTEGLLLLTTDGELKRQLELPSSGVERVYRARAFGEISQERLEQLIEGIEIEGVRYGPIDANLERRTGRNQWIELKLAEGKNREVRRVLEHLGLKVSRLIRTAYGPFPLGDLPAGQVEEIRQHDLVLFRRQLAAGKAEALSAPAERMRPLPRGAGERAARAAAASAAPVDAADRRAAGERPRPQRRAAGKGGGAAAKPKVERGPGRPGKPSGGRPERGTSEAARPSGRRGAKPRPSGGRADRPGGSKRPRPPRSR